MDARKIKKVFGVVLCLCMVLLVTPLSIFAAKNLENNAAKECEHTFDEEYYRGEKEGHYPECDYCTYYDESVLKEHIDADNDDWCDVCGYSAEHEHTYNEGYYHGEENGHYPECDYCAYYDASILMAHISGDNDDWCEVCDYFVEHEHTYNEEFYHVEKGWHALECDYCAYYGESVLDGHINKDNDEWCDECGYFMQHEHTFDNECYFETEYGHYYECDQCEIYLENSFEEHKLVRGECVCGFRGIIITEQPEDVKAAAGEKFSISFKAEGDGLKYQWYYKESYMKEFKESSNRTSDYAYTMQSYMNNRSVYCVITDSYGNQVTTDTATIMYPAMELKVLEQPKDVKAAVGEKFSISFKVQGEGLKYQWYYKESYMKEFKASSNRTSAYAYVMQSYMNNRSVYCVITDEKGNQVQTETVTITYPVRELKLLEQPKDVKAAVGEKFSISFKVQGEGLKYQWYYKESYMKEFKASSNRTSAYAYVMQSYMNNRSVYCVITDEKGNQVQTETVTIAYPAQELKLLEQPKDVKAAVGERFSISFKVQGEGLKYQWYYKESYMKEFKESSNRTATYAYAMQSYMNNRSVYCVITDENGNQVQTKTVTIYLGN